MTPFTDETFEAFAALVLPIWAAVITLAGVFAWLKDRGR